MENLSRHLVTVRGRCIGSCILFLEAERARIRHLLVDQCGYPLCLLVVLASIHHRSYATGPEDSVLLGVGNSKPSKTTYS